MKKKEKNYLDKLIKAYKNQFRKISTKNRMQICTKNLTAREKKSPLINICT